MRDDALSPTSSPLKKSGRVQGKKLTRGQRKEAQEKFLKSFASNGIVRVACLASGIDRSTVHYWSEHDEQFSMRYNVAKTDVDDAIRAEIFRRAMYGDDETTISEETFMLEGVPVTKRKSTTSKRKSDLLLMFHAKARMPEYREQQQIDHTISFKEQAEKAYDGLLGDLLAKMTDEDKEQTNP